MIRRRLKSASMGQPFDCWGDSMTFGTGAATVNTAWTSLLGNSYSPFRPIFMGGVFGETSDQILVRFLARGNTARRGNVCTFWWGTNDAATAFATVLPDLQTALADLETPKRFIIIPPNPKASHSVQAMTNLQACTASIIAAYPDNIVNALALLQANGDGSPTDNDEIAAGKVPTSLLAAADQTHLNDTGHAIVYAGVKAKMIALGY